MRKDGGYPPTKKKGCGWPVAVVGLMLASCIAGVFVAVFG